MRRNKKLMFEVLAFIGDSSDPQPRMEDLVDGVRPDSQRAAVQFAVETLMDQGFLRFSARSDAPRLKLNPEGHRVLEAVEQQERELCRWQGCHQTGEQEPDSPYQIMEDMLD